MADPDLAVDGVRQPARSRPLALRVALVAATVVVLWVMLSQAPGGRAADILLRASSQWMLAAGAVSIVPIVAMAAAFVVMTARPLPWVQTTLVQLATSFTNALAPAGAGGAALNARYLHCRGLPLAEAVAVVAVVQLTSIVATLTLLVLVLVTTGDLSAAASRVPVAAVGWLVAVIGSAALLAARWQRARRLLARRLVRPLRKVWPQLRGALASPLRLFGLLTSHMLVTAGLGATLWCCLRAFDVELPLTVLLLALLAGSAVGSAAPVPGGIGTVEAATAAALLTAGVPAADAVAVALLYRLTTFWGRLPAGWACLLWLRRRGYV